MAAHAWHVVTSPGGVILGVFGRAVPDAARACAQRVQRETGVAAYVEVIRSNERPKVGQLYEREN